MIRNNIKSFGGIPDLAEIPGKSGNRYDIAGS